MQLISHELSDVNCMDPIMIWHFFISVSDFSEKSEEFLITNLKFLKKFELVKNAENDLNVTNTIPSRGIKINSPKSLLSP